MHVLGLQRTLPESSSVSMTTALPMLRAIKNAEEIERLAAAGAAAEASLEDLSAIASVGSAVSLSVFVLVGIAGYRLRDQIKGRRGVLALAVAAAGFVPIFFVVDTLRNDPSTFAAIVVSIALAIALDFSWKRAKLKTENGP